MSGLLSLVLLPMLGICLVLLRNQLLDGWVRRCDAAIEVADVGPVESITGVLMCGVSVYLLFAIAMRLVGIEGQRLAKV